MNDIIIAGRKIGADHPPFIIAEMSANHNQSLNLALEIVEAAAKAGAHALKLQTYTADTMTLNLNHNEFYIDDPNSLWHGNSLYNLYQQAYTPWEWHKTIFDRCNELGIIGFSTPFDNTSVDFLESLDVPLYKIASFENTDIPLLKKIARTNKPIIMSTGMATVSELAESVETLKNNGCKDLILLKCTSSYPATPETSNILTIPHMKELFNCQVGLSDHSAGIGVAAASIALGATIIEKHFILSKNSGGVDASFSIEPDELELLVTETKRAWQGLGRINYGITEKEKNSLKFRRSLYIVEDVKAGESFTSSNIRSIRPGLGLPPKYYDLILRKKASCSIKTGTPLNWDFVGGWNE